jgi:hypothetical protein
MHEVRPDRWRRRVLAVATAALAAAVTGCGSSHSGSSSSTPSSSATRSTQTTGVGAAGVAAAGSYHGDGFEVAIPSGWHKLASAAATTGASGIVFGPAGDTKTSITIHSYRQPTEGIDQTLADVVTSDKVEESTGQMRNIRAQVHTAQVQGAAQAKELSESFTGPAGQVRYVDLVALTRSGTMVTVEAAAPANGSGFDPASAVRSLRITGG